MYTSAEWGNVGGMAPSDTTSMAKNNINTAIIHAAPHFHFGRVDDDDDGGREDVIIEEDLTATFAIPLPPPPEVVVVLDEDCCCCGGVDVVAH